MEALAHPASGRDLGSHPPGVCFGSVRFLAARIPLDVDVYTIYPTHNFTGPNTHFLSIFGALEKLASAGIAKYATFSSWNGYLCVSPRLGRCPVSGCT